jgi:hypothetical protein
MSGSQFSGGYLNKTGTTGNTQVVLSSRFKVFSPAVGVGKFQRMGVCSTFNISESKTLEAIRGLGYGDQVAELAPSVTQPMELQITRTALYLANMFQMLGYKSGVSGLVRSIKHHRWPFDIRTEIVFSALVSTSPYLAQATTADVDSEGGFNNLGNPGLMAVATIYEACWINNYSSAFNIDQAAVTEEVGVTVSDVYDCSGSIYGDFEDSGNSPSDATGASLRYTGATAGSAQVTQ